MRIFLLTILLIFCFTSCQKKESKLVFVKEMNLKVDRFEVSIADFDEFAKANKYISTADSFKWSGVFNANTGNWDVTENANWQKPKGIKYYEKNYPATQISFYDACNFCKWKIGRLPTAKEWDKFAGDNVITGNVWQGLFPVLDEGKDGYKNCVAPIGQFKPNKYGLHDLFGNVWEWTTTKESNGHMIIKGGSFLCDFDICSGFIPSRYQTTSKDSGLNHLGFRCVYDN